MFKIKLRRITPLDIFCLKGCFCGEKNKNTKVDKWIKEGRGTGSGAEYQPWLFKMFPH